VGPWGRYLGSHTKCGAIRGRAATWLLDAGYTPFLVAGGQHPEGGSAHVGFYNKSRFCGQIWHLGPVEPFTTRRNSQPCQKLKYVVANCFIIYVACFISNNSFAVFGSSPFAIDYKQLRTPSPPPTSSVERSAVYNWLCICESVIGNLFAQGHGVC